MSPSSYQTRCPTWLWPSWMMLTSKGRLPAMRPLRMDGILQPPLRNPHCNHIWSHVHRVRMVFFMRLLRKIHGICRFVCDHVNDVNRILQWFKKAGGTFSSWKMDLCIPEVVAIGHKCTYEGHYPEDQKVQKILDWPACTSPTEIPGCMWHFQDLGQGLCEMCKTTGCFDEEGCGVHVGSGTRGGYGGSQASYCY